MFTEAGTEVEVRPIDHASHQASTRIRDLFTGAQHWLHLGVGATGEALPGSIELETAIFVHTHVVADVHHLPFADGVLGGVLALNVFEHLEDPELAARELHRVLSPGSAVLVQTAFLQPLHADPYHYYNTTEVGSAVLVPPVPDRCRRGARQLQPAVRHVLDGERAPLPLRRR